MRRRDGAVSGEHRLRRAVRTALVGQEVDGRVRMALVRATVRATISANKVGAPIPVLVWIVLRPSLGQWVTVWAIVLATSLAVFTACLRWVGRRVDKGHFERREQSMLVGVFALSGVLWGSLTLLPSVPGDDGGTFTLMSVIIVLAAAANTIFGSSYFGAYIGYHIAIVVSSSIGFLRHGHGEMFALMLVAGASAVPIRGLLHGALARAVETTLRNERLVEELRTANAKLETQAMIDPLTGLGNRHRFASEMTERATEVSRDRRCLIFIDVDDFKVINDTYGHGGGDLLLRTIGDRLQTVIRDRDILARFGGDEFVVLAEVSDTDAAVALAERMRRSLRDPVDLSGVPVSCTLSIGIASSPDGQDLDVNELTRRADAALYRAKAAGKDTVRVHGDEGHCDGDSASSAQRDPPSHRPVSR